MFVSGFVVLISSKLEAFYTWNGAAYRIEEMTWHTPSEHQMDGKSYPAELQLLYKTLEVKLESFVLLHERLSRAAMQCSSSLLLAGRQPPLSFEMLFPSSQRHKRMASGPSTLPLRMC